jgi:hypothetical protein
MYLLIRNHGELKTMESRGKNGFEDAPMKIYCERRKKIVYMT